MPEQHGKHTRHAEYQRKGEKIPLFPEKIYVWITKKFHVLETPYVCLLITTAGLGKQRPEPASHQAAFCLMEWASCPGRLRPVVLNTQRLSPLLPAQYPVKNHAGHKYGRK